MRGRPAIAASPNLPNRIRKLRELRGWTVRDLAERVGIHERDVSRHELGHRQIKQGQLAAYARALEVTIDQLIPGPPTLSAVLSELLTAARKMSPRMQAKLVRIAHELNDDSDSGPASTSA